MEQKQKDAASAMSKRAKKPSNKSNFAYWGWGGGAAVLVVGLMVILFWEPKADKETRSIKEIPVNDEVLIDKVNRLATTWQADATPFFDGFTLKAVKYLGTNAMDSKAKIRACPVGKVALLRSFDARNKWPECFKQPIVTQGNCSSSLALVAASSMANRFCIADPSNFRSLTMSAQQLISCDKASNGCNGGPLDAPFKYMKDNGLVSTDCFPYKASDQVACDAKCKDEPHKSLGYCKVNSMGNVMAEIQLNGPVLALLSLTKDIFVYKSGVYKPITETSKPLLGRGRRRLMHAVKIIGWGSTDDEEKVPYWIVENSWGSDWGEKGYGKIFRAHDDSGVLVEGFVMAGYTAELPLPPKKKDELDDLDDDDDDDEDDSERPAAKDKDIDDLDEEEVSV